MTHLEPPSRIQTLPDSCKEQPASPRSDGERQGHLLTFGRPRQILIIAHIGLLALRTVILQSRGPEIGGVERFHSALDFTPSAGKAKNELGRQQLFTRFR